MKQFKKVLAFVLALAMVVTAVPTADAKAAAKQPKLNNTKKILYVGQSYTLKIGNLPANWKKCTYAWSASNKNVTVKKGKYGQAASVKANKAGTATVTVKMTYPQTAAQKKAKKKTVKTFKCVVTVKNPSVKFTTTADRIEVGETAQFTAKATPSTAKVTYTSSNKEVATVDATGLVTAVADGTATIKASAKIGTKTVTATKSVEVYTAPTEAKQTKVKEITITSGKVVTKESKIAVKKGSVEVALAEKDGISIDATGKTVVLTTAAKLTKGEYTVTIDDATANFTAEDEKVTDIEFTSDKAVLDAQVCANTLTTPAGTCTGTESNHKMIYHTATAAYKVYNQFKEDITDTTNVSLSGSNVPDAPVKKGEIVFTSQATDGFRLNDIVAAVVIYNENGVAVTKSGTFTVTNEAAISEISIKDGLYNKKGEAVTVTEDTDLTKEAVYVLVSAKDQYGRAVTSLTDKGNVYVQLAEGLTNIKFRDDNGSPAVLDASEEITVDGVKYAGFKLVVKDTTAGKKQGAGTATVLVISKGTGVTAQGTVTIANGSKIDTLTIQVPDLVVGNEDTKLGYTALDTYGKEVTSVDAFKNIGITDDPSSIGRLGSVADGKIYVKENPLTGKAELIYRAKPNNEQVNDYDVETILTSTYKSTTVQLSVRPNAVPTAITGTKDLTTGSLTTGTYKIKAENIKVVDQYGRADKVSDSADYSLKASTGANDYKAFTAQVNDVVVTDSETALASAATAAGTSKVKFTLYKTTSGVAKEVSSYEVEYNTVAEGDIKTYEVADIGNVFAGKYVANSTENNAITDYNKTFDVKGVTADGIKVKLDDDWYSATANKALTGVTYKDGEITTVDLSGTGDPLEKVDSTEVTVTFTFNDGQKIEKTVTFTKEAPKAVSAKIADNDEVIDVAAASLTATNIVAELEVKDQYGVKLIGTKPRITASNLKGSNFKVTKGTNGTDALAFDSSTGTVDAGYTADLVFTFDGGFTFSAKLQVK